MSLPNTYRQLEYIQSSGTQYIEITINPQGSGYVEKSYVGEKVSLNAIANTDYEFVNWLLKGYTQLEYIESTGTQWIDTQLVPSQVTKAIGDLQFTALNKCAMFGSYNGSYWNNLFGINIDENHFWCQWGDTYNGPANKDTLRHIHSFERNGNTSWTYKVDNLIYTNSSGIATQSSGKNMYLFATNNNGTLYRQSSAKLYSFKVWNGNEIIRDYIPVIRHIDGQVGLLDLVNLKFYGNSGTGEFVGGNVVGGNAL